MRNYLAFTAIALIAASAGATGSNNQYMQYNDENAAIQKGGSASTKAYGDDKQGDHYSPSRTSWREQTYPGIAPASGGMVRKGGSGITDTDTSTEANHGSVYRNSAYPYGTR